MSISTATLDETKAAYKAIAQLSDALKEFYQGSPAASRSVGRYTIAEMDALVATATAALTAIA